jgi:hypothetical protein
MTTQTKKYLKIGIGIALIVGKLAGPKPYFWSWDNPEGVGYNVAGIVILGIAFWLLYSAGRTK